MKKLLLLVAVVFSIGNAYSQICGYYTGDLGGGWYAENYYMMSCNGDDIYPVSQGVISTYTRDSYSPEDGDFTSLDNVGGDCIIKSDGNLLISTYDIGLWGASGPSGVDAFPANVECGVEMGGTSTCFGGNGMTGYAQQFYYEENGIPVLWQDFQFETPYDPSSNGLVVVTYDFFANCPGGYSEVSWWSQF